MNFALDEYVMSYAISLAFRSIAASGVFLMDFPTFYNEYYLWKELLKNLKGLKAENHSVISKKLRHDLRKLPTKVAYFVFPNHREWFDPISNWANTVNY